MTTRRLIAAGWLAFAAGLPGCAGLPHGATTMAVAADEAPAPKAAANRPIRKDAEPAVPAAGPSQAVAVVDDAPPAESPVPAVAKAQAEPPAPKEPSLAAAVRKFEPNAKRTTKDAVPTTTVAAKPTAPDPALAAGDASKGPARFPWLQRASEPPAAAKLTAGGNEPPPPPPARAEPKVAKAAEPASPGPLSLAATKAAAPTRSAAPKAPDGPVKSAVAALAEDAWKDAKPIATIDTPTEPKPAPKPAPPKAAPSAVPVLVQTQAKPMPSVAPPAAGGTPDEAGGAFGIARLTTADEVLGFGRVEPATGPAAPGRLVLLYAEPHGYVSRRVGKAHQVKLTGSVALEDAAGKAVATVPFPTVVDECDAPRQDFFCCFQFQLPEDLRPGDYRLRLRLRDDGRGATAERTTPLAVRAATQGGESP